MRRLLLCIYKILFSYMFRAINAHLQEDTFYTCSIWYCHHGTNIWTAVVWGNWVSVVRLRWWGLIDCLYEVCCRGGLIRCLYEGCSSGVLIGCCVKAVVEVELALCIQALLVWGVNWLFIWRLLSWRVNWLFIWSLFWWSVNWLFCEGCRGGRIGCLYSGFHGVRG